MDLQISALKENWKAYLLIGLGPCVVLVVTVYLAFASGAIPTADERAARAAAENHTAQLAAVNDPAELRTLLSGHHPEALRAAAAQRLGRLRVKESLPQLVEMMEDESLLVRGRAGVAVQQILGVGIHFKANAPAQERAKVVGELRRLVEFRNQESAGNTTIAQGLRR